MANTQHAQIAIFKFAIYLEKPKTQLFYYAIKTRPTVTDIQCRPIYAGCTYYRTASLLCPARCYAPPPTIFGQNYCIGLFYLHYTPPPCGPLEPVCGTAVLARVLVLQGRRSCIKRVEISLRTGLVLFRWSQTVFRLRPSSCRRGRWEESGCYVLWQHVRGQQLFHPSVLPRHVDLVFYRTTEYTNSWEGGRGLTARRKRKSSLLRPLPPLFPESRSQKGGA